MGRVPGAQSVWAMTSRLAIKFGEPVLLDGELTIAGELARSRSRAYEVQGQIRLPDSTVLATGTGVHVRILDEIIEQTKSKLDSREVAPDWSDDVAFLPSYAM